MNNDVTPVPDPNQFNPQAPAQVPPRDNTLPGTLSSPTINTGPISIQGQPNEQQRRLKIFISYAHQDHELRQKLNEHLTPLTYSENLEIWQDQEIPPGADWKDHIDTHLKDADVILLLVSSSFIASEYCWSKEVLAALERHKAKTARVVPIILKPVRWQDTPLGQLQALPTGAKPVIQWDDVDTALENVAQGIKRAVKDLLLRDGQWTRTITEEIRSAFSTFPLNVKKTLIGIIVILVLLGLGAAGGVLFRPNPPKTQLTRLGGVDLNSYCRSLHYDEVIDDSACFSDINMNAACNWQWKRTDLVARNEHPSNRDGWHCTAPKDPQWDNQRGINNMSGYCEDQNYYGQPEAQFEQNMSKWVCQQKIDMTIVCIWQYSRRDIQASRNDAGLWSCSISS